MPGYFKKAAKKKRRRHSKKGGTSNSIHKRRGGAGCGKHRTKKMTKLTGGKTRKIMRRR